MSSYALIGRHNSGTDRVPDESGPGGMVYITCSLTVDAGAAPGAAYDAIEAISRPDGSQSLVFDNVTVVGNESMFRVGFRYSDLRNDGHAANNHAPTGVDAALHDVMTTVADALLKAWQERGHDVTYNGVSLFALSVVYAR